MEIDVIFGSLGGEPPSHIVLHWESAMKRKPTRAAIDAAAGAPRRKSFLKSSANRLLNIAEEHNLPVSQLVASPDGTLSLVVGDNKPNDTTTKNPWDEVSTNAANEKRPT